MMKMQSQFMRAALAMGCLVAILSTSGCGRGDLLAWEYSIDVAQGHTVLRTEGFELWFEAKARKSRTKGRLLVVGYGSSDVVEKGVGDGVFTHQFTGGELVMTLFGNTFKVVDGGKTLVVGGESFPVGLETKPTILLRADGSAKVGTVGELVGGVSDEPADGKDGGKKDPANDLSKPL
jgi:hypothetical protein